MIGGVGIKRKHGIILLVLAIFVIGVVIGISVFISYINNYDKMVSDIEITTPDLTRIPDGKYEGSYVAFPVEVKVEVSVIGHKITEINLLKHQNGKGSAAEAIPSKVVDTQTLDVETVTGATASSKVILKAIEAALGNVSK